MIERDKVKIFDLRDGPYYKVYSLETNPYVETANEPKPFHTIPPKPVRPRQKWWNFWKSPPKPEYNLPPLSRIRLVIVGREAHYVNESGTVETGQRLMNSHVARLVKTVPADGELVLLSDPDDRSFAGTRILWRKSYAELKEYLKQPEESEIYCTNPESWHEMEYDTRKIERVQALGREIVAAMKNRG